LAFLNRLCTLQTDRKARRALTGSVGLYSVRR
jgi:hypothetical protein